MRYFFADLQKNGHSYITAENPDIFCLQETKCDKESIPKSVELDGYHTYWLSGEKDGYSGTGLFAKKKPISVKYGIGKKLVPLCETSTGLPDFYLKFLHILCVCVGVRGLCVCRCVVRRV